MIGFESPSIALDPDIYRGTIQQIIAVNLGEYVYCDFVIGTDRILTKSGYLYDVGLKYLVLYQPECQYYEVCDIFNVKFITFVNGFKRTKFQDSLAEDIKNQIKKLKLDRTSKFGTIENP